MTKHLLTTDLIHALPASDRRGLNRKEAASYVGISVGSFDKLIQIGEMPPPIKLGARKVWDRSTLDAALDAKMPSSRFVSPSRNSDAAPARSPLDAWRQNNG